MLKAGMMRVDITPPLGVKLSGYPHYPRHNTGVHDPLYAACMYLECNGAEVAMVTLDMLAISKIFVAEIRRRAAERCGIPAENIMISCSHSHSSPRCAAALDIDSLKNGQNRPEAYISEMIDKVAGAIVKAKEECFEGWFASGTAICGAESGVGGNRRVRGGPHDPLVSVMAVKDCCGNVRGAMVNYALHPTFIHEWSTVCTADYPCYVKQEIEDNYPTALTGFAQGTSGNQSSRYYRHGESYDEAERVGRAIGKAACTVIQKAEWKDDIAIKTASKCIEIEYRSFGTVEERRKIAERDKAVYEELYAKYGKSEKREEYYLWQNANLRHLGSEKQLAYALIIESGVKIDLCEEENPTEIQVFNLGGTCVVGLQGEIFVEYGLYIKAMAGYGTVIVNELANGCHPGYMYTPESLNTGGYETDTSMLHRGFGVKLVDNVLQLAKQVK